MATRQAAASEVREGRRTAIASHDLELLGRRFAEFHRQHPRRTRIPDDLRRDALAALEQGVSRTQLRRACGVSSKQLEQWQARRGKIQSHADPVAPDARVFSVVGDSPTLGVEPAGLEQDKQLELRLDGWSICVRRLDR